MLSSLLTEIGFSLCLQFYFLTYSLPYYIGKVLAIEKLDVTISVEMSVFGPPEHKEFVFTELVSVEIVGKKITESISSKFTKNI